MGNCKCKKLSEEDKLESSSFDYLEYFSFNGLKVKAKVVSIYDGDTCTVVFFYNANPIKLRLRMEGYDAPELKPKNDVENRELHMEAGKKSRDKLKELVLGKVVRLEINDKNNDKYGRLLGTLYYKGENINNYMILNKFGKKYTGGKKEDFTIEELNYILKQ